MSMSINSVTENIGLTGSVTGVKTSEPKKESEVKTDVAEVGAVYEKSGDTKSATYSVNKMSPEERAAMIDRLKADQADRESRFTKLVTDMMNGQVTAFGKANNIWEFLASGEFTVDPATKPLDAKK